jgi:hypothetical protein
MKCDVTDPVAEMWEVKLIIGETEMNTAVAY